ncbi:hypothetical protein Tco_0571327 [Tanacetum coccineum]
MHTTMVPEQVKTMKIQAGIQVSRPGELRRQLQLWKRFGRFYLIVFVLVSNIYDALIELPKCVCNASESFKKHNQLLRLMQFLMGLDDSYMQIRTSILFKEVLPDVRSAYATISSEESHRVAADSIVGSS